MHLKGVDLQMQDYDKRTALHLAASEGHADVVDYLLNVAHVKPDSKDRWKRTPLHDAQSENHQLIVALLQRSMSIYEQDEYESELDETPISTPRSQDLSSDISDSLKTEEGFVMDNQVTYIDDAEMIRKKAIPSLM